ncbi:hypothetical protein DM02DRAFT_650492 [Periconia macrospinosa]|uniref:BRCT domain-containing protein n=1 Tax=Periconia macrospinosa TaxID=97972 RepID=A0A2V1E5G9_9PLEO|nr:hypothetical protein DM02DRAFT_650492 [Periconia macrospinosa]
MPPKKQETIAVRSDGLTGEKLIITGEIQGQTRKSAEQVLKNAGATFEKSLNKKVTLVVLGDKPGGDKLAKIEDLGCKTITWDELMDDIKIGGGDEDDNDDTEEEEEEEEEKVSKARLSKTQQGAPSVSEIVPSACQLTEFTQQPKPKKSTKPAPKAPAAKPTTKAAPKAAAKPASKPKPKSKKTTSTLDGKTVIVTGTVPGHERKEVSKILEDAGATVAKSLNKSVELVILGTKPGPDKLKKIDDMGIETIEWDDVAEELGIEVQPQKEVADVEIGGAPNSVEGMTLLITGEIDGHTRSTAQKVLEKEGAKFAKSLTNAVELVVLGINPGPDKLEQIKKKGIKTCNWVDLVKELDIEDGAPPKKKAKKN